MSEIFKISGYDIKKLTNVFNLGVGVVMACDSGAASKIIADCSEWGAYALGEVTKKDHSLESGVVYV